MKSATLLLLAGGGALGYLAWSKRSTAASAAPVKIVVDKITHWERVMDGTCLAVTITTYADGSKATTTAPASTTLCAPAPVSGLGSYLRGH